jgi:twitching motility protein PilT
MNDNRESHIITLEDPIEYTHMNNKCLINQREIGQDTSSYSSGLRAVLRQDPDIIMIGEMRDLESISIALTAAETGHLVLSTLHTIGAGKTIDRIIDVFPAYQQQQIRIQLSMVLQGLISQQLIPKAESSGRVVATEVMIPNAAIRNLIRTSKIPQIESVIQTNLKAGMKTTDMSIMELYKEGTISYDVAVAYSMDQSHIISSLQDSRQEVISV